MKQVRDDGSSWSVVLIGVEGAFFDDKIDHAFILPSASIIQATYGKAHCSLSGNHLDSTATHRGSISLWLRRLR